jgi:hypothetical protein
MSRRKTFEKISRKDVAMNEHWSEAIGKRAGKN